MGLEQRKYDVDKNQDGKLDEKELKSLSEVLSSPEDSSNFIEGLNNNIELKELTSDLFLNELKNIKSKIVNKEKLNSKDVLLLQGYAVLFMGKSMEEVGMFDNNITEEIKEVFGDVLNGIDLESANKKDISDVKIQLFGEDINLDDFTLSDMPEELRSSIIAYQNVILIEEIYQIWSDKAISVSNSLWLKYLRNDDDIINKQVGGIGQQIAKIKGMLMNGEKVDIKDMKYIFSLMHKGEEQETIIGDDDIVDIEQILFNDSLEMSEKRIQIYNKMREGWIDEGNSPQVSEILSGRLIEQQEFSDIKEFLNNSEKMKIVVNILENGGDISKLKEIGIPEDIARKSMEKYKEYLTSNKKQKDDIKEGILQRNPRLKESPDELQKEIEATIEFGSKISTCLFLKHELLKDNIQKKELKGTGNEYIDTYSDIEGLGIGDVKDTNKSVILEIGVNVALLAVPLGAGIVAAKLTVAGGRYLYSATRLASLISKTGKVGRVIETTGVIGAEGLGFYQGYNLTNNIIYDQESPGLNSFHGFDDWREIGKFTVFIGIMKGMSPILNRLNLSSIKPLDKIQPKVLKAMMDEGGKITATGGTMAATSLLIEKLYMSLGDDESYPDITWKDFAELVLLAGMYRGAEKIGYNIKNRKTEEIGSTSIVVDNFEYPVEGLKRNKIEIREITEYQNLNKEQLEQIGETLRSVLGSMKFNNFEHPISMVKHYENGKTQNSKYTLQDAFTDINFKIDRIVGSNCAGMSEVVKSELSKLGIKSYIVRFDAGGLINNEYVVHGHAAVVIPIEYKKGIKGFKLVDPGLLIPKSIEYVEGKGGRKVVIGKKIYEIFKNQEGSDYPFRMEVIDPSKSEPKRLNFDPYNEWQNPLETLNKDIIRADGDFKIMKQSPEGIREVIFTLNINTREVGISTRTDGLKFNGKTPIPMTFEEFLNLKSNPKALEKFHNLCRMLAEDPNKLYNDAVRMIRASDKIKNQIWAPSTLGKARELQKLQLITNGNNHGNE